MLLRVDTMLFPGAFGCLHGHSIRAYGGHVMKLLLLSLMIICLSLQILPAMVSAQTIDPRCAGMRDKVGCTCAVQNGGNVYPYCPQKFNQAPWCYPRGGLEGYVQCMHRHGRK